MEPLRQGGRGDLLKQLLGCFVGIILFVVRNFDGIIWKVMGPLSCRIHVFFAGFACQLRSSSAEWNANGTRNQIFLVKNPVFRRGNQFFRLKSLVFRTENKVFQLRARFPRWKTMFFGPAKSFVFWPEN